MKIDNTHSPAFGASIPVYYYAKDKAGKVWRIMKPENIKKCNSYIIRNLTGSIKKKNDGLISLFKRFDSEYKTSGKIRSVYDNEKSTVYLVTGKKDCDIIREMGEKLGKTKSESIHRTNTTKTFEVIEAAKQFFKNALQYVKRNDIKKKTNNGTPLSAHIIFDAVYKKNGEIKGFKYNNINFSDGQTILNFQ